MHWCSTTWRKAVSRMKDVSGHIKKQVSRCSPICNSTQLPAVLHGIAPAAAVAHSPGASNRHHANVTLCQWWQHGSPGTQGDALCCEDIVIWSPAGCCHGHEIQECQDGECVFDLGCIVAFDASYLTAFGCTSVCKQIVLHQADCSRSQHTLQHRRECSSRSEQPLSRVHSVLSNNTIR